MLFVPPRKQLHWNINFAGEIPMANDFQYRTRCVDTSQRIPRWNFTLTGQHTDNRDKRRR